MFSPGFFVPSRPGEDRTTDPHQAWTEAPEGVWTGGGLAEAFTAVEGWASLLRITFADGATSPATSSRNVRRTVKASAIEQVFES